MTIIKILPLKIQQQYFKIIIRYKMGFLKLLLLDLLLSIQLGVMVFGLICIVFLIYKILKNK